jgi:CRP-like cAMP-binding protein
VQTASRHQNNAAVSQTNVVALEDTVIVFANRPTLDSLFKNYPDFEKFGRLLYEKVLINYKQRNLFRVRLNARDRYLHFLENEPELIKRVPLKYISSYLNVTDTSLSRIRRSMQQIAD